MKPGCGKTIIAMEIFAYLEREFGFKKMFFVTHNSVLEEQVTELMNDMGIKNVKVISPEEL